MKKTIKIAVVGSGAMARAHAFSVSALKYCYKDLPFSVKLDTLVTRSKDSAKDKAESLGFENFTADYESVLKREDIDIIDICTPNMCHYEQVKAALEAGKNVLCEKPLAVSTKEADELALLAKESGKVCGTVFNNRHLPAIIRAKELFSEGALGKILSFRSVYHHSSATDPSKPCGWKQDKDFGGGVLYDLGSHAIDLLNFVIGDLPENKISSVRGLSQIAYPVRTYTDGSEWQTNADEAFYITAKLVCGACGTIEASKITAGANDDFTLEIYGTEGALKFNLMNPNFLSFYSVHGKDSPNGGFRGYTNIECVNRYDIPESVFPGIRAPIGWARGHIHSMFSFITAVYKNEPFSPSFDDGAYVNRIIEKSYLSDKTGKEEKTGY